ncbi:ATP-binding cassette domain-containing protein [Paracoccus suum]|uniref:ATP-binding cassette domain-containing protein n=1 Tax=Paracoccus suum TaxID=2259340 RepID=A0A344PJQ7_9RHOB|nr:ATP-binding cassette domain-containing protein [Paracoccus suum]AXC49612.1 ATP-binding cassette domain-containing protein [Paracoccus suum]
MSDAPLLEVRGLTKGFGPKAVLRGVDLTLAKGESLVVIGGSGTGKSVLLRCILGLDTPDSGDVLWHGRPLSGAARAQFMDRFGMLFQGGALFDSLNVWQNVAFRLTQPMGARAAREVAVERLARVGLGPEVADLYPADLSGGMLKRVALARAIAASPEVIFFDEPTTGLDPLRAARITALIRGIVSDTGASAISITHDMASAQVMADRVALLQDGRIVWTGRPAEMQAAATQVPALAAFLDPVAALAATPGH